MVILFIFTLSNLELIGKEPAQKEVETSEKIVTRSASETATFIVKLLSTKDWKGISKLVHPTRGVRFSPYAYVFTNRGVVLSQEKIVEFANSDKKVIWGEYEGRGNSIELSMNGYYKRFLYRYDYKNVKHGPINTRVGQSSSVNRILKAYPEDNIAYFDFYFKDPLDQKSADNWGSLRVVLQKENKQWFLVSFVNDQWGP